MTDSKYSHRMNAAQLKITDAGGNAVKNSDISYELVNHEFLFGCGAFDAVRCFVDENSGEDYIYNEVKANGRDFFRDRVDKWLALFNYGTLPFYWGTYEDKEGFPHFESRMQASKFLQENNVTVKGHPLCWHTVCADWLLKYDNATILDKQLKRIDRDVSAFKGVIDIWDVINETVIMPEFDRYDNAVTRICNAYGRINLIKEVFSAAKAANPNAVLLINDFNLSEKYHDVIAECLDAGVPVSAIGLQSHQHQGYMGKEKLYEVIERFSDLGLPLHFTENTLVSGHLMPPHIVDLNDYQVDEWNTTKEGEIRQCKEWKEMYEILFASPSVEAVTGWDFADGAWLHAPSGIIREDNTLKPSYKELHRLVFKEWTSKGTMHTDDNGICTLEGFCGEYVLSAYAGSAKINMLRNKDYDMVDITLEQGR